MDFDHEDDGANDDGRQTALWNIKEIRRQDRDGQQNEGSYTINKNWMFNILYDLHIVSESLYRCIVRRRVFVRRWQN
jgi:hypothetical protein